MNRNDYFRESSSPNNCRNVLTRIYFTKQTRVFYLLLILLSFFSMVWVLANLRGFPKETWFIVLEIFVCSAMVAEISLRTYLLGLKRFFKNKANTFDMLVTALCIVAIGLAFAKAFLEEVEGVVGTVVIIVRNVFLLFRVLVLIKNQMNTKTHKVYLRSPSRGLSLNQYREEPKGDPETLYELEEPSSLHFNDSAFNRKSPLYL